MIMAIDTGEGRVLMVDNEARQEIDAVKETARQWQREGASTGDVDLMIAGIRLQDAMEDLE